nr:VTC domain-containing protein [Clostridium botulinum]
MRNGGKKFRHELKYYINYNDYISVRNRIKYVLKLDQNADESGEYFIRSLYYDDIYDSALYEKNFGVNIRKKYRIRIYNMSDEVIKLERKNKVGQYVCKESATISRKEYDEIINGDYKSLVSSKHPLKRDFYWEIKNKILAPKVIVDYDREAYVGKISETRITFDKNLRVSYTDNNIFNENIATQTIIAMPKMIMEVKFNEFLPESVRKMICIDAEDLSAISKYVFCRVQKIIYKWRGNMDKSLTFQDIFKKSFTQVDHFGKIPISQVVICLIITAIVASFIFYIYKDTFRGVVYSYSYNISLFVMSLLTSLIVLTISSNVALSLGMVGALSIVRFRTAIKDPMDVMYMFWAITVGIACGAKIYSVAILGSLLVGLAIKLLTNYKVKNNTYMFIIHYEEKINEKLIVTLQEVQYFIKSKSITRGVTEMALEVKVKNNNTAFVNEISEMEGVIDASLVRYNGDYAE